MNEQLDLDKLSPNSFPYLVALEPRNDGSADLYFRRENKVETRNVSFKPWLLVQGRELADELSGNPEIIPLEGTGVFNYRAVFPDESEYRKAVKDLKQITGRNNSAPDAPYRLFTDLSQQAFTTLSARLFRGLVFPDIRRLQFDIETYTSSGYDFPNPKRKDDAVIMIAMSDNTGWEQLLAAPELDEKTILQEMMRLIKERDPDVLEGHNIFNFDLPYIEERCRRHKIKLTLGRDGSAAKSRSSRFTAAERTSTYTRYDIHGRHVVDTMHLAQLYDIVQRSLPGYNLKQIASHFGVAAPDRTYIKGENISTVFKDDPEKLKEYAMDDVRETAAIAEILSPSYFYQAQLTPFSYQNCITRGNAARIDAILCASYITADYSLPRPEAPRSFPGGLTDSPRSGIFYNVWHVDIRSLYPSIILSRDLCPSRDSRGVFPAMLRELRNFRYTAKDAAGRATERRDKDHYNALQGSFKILINSFYGYLGFSQATFNDFTIAEEVTSTGRNILRSMVDFLEEQGAQVIEIDTDGIYFTPPSDENNTASFTAELQQILPSGIDVELDATFKAMLAYKSKNYALLERDGKITITGAALKSRGLEPFQRYYIQELISLLLRDQGDKIPELYEKYRQAIMNREFDLSNLAKRENLSTPPRVYKEKLKAGTGRRSAAYELVVNSNREYRQGDQVAFYMTGSNKNTSLTDGARLLQDNDGSERDENVEYYLDKLKKLHEKFSSFIPNSGEADLFQGN